MNEKFNNGPATKVFNVDEFALGLRHQCLCIPFESLKLSGPEGEFEANGLLVSRGEKLILECSPRTGVSIPMPAKSGFLINYTPSDYWVAEGRSLHGLNLIFSSLVPFLGLGSLQMNQNGEFRTFEIEVSKISIVDSPMSQEDQDVLNESIKRINAKRRKSCEQSSRTEPTVINANIRAFIPNTTLKIFNSGVITVKTHPYFEHPVSSQKFDVFVGSLDNWEFCFAQEGCDVVVYMRTKDGYSSSSPRNDVEIMNGLLGAFGFVHGIVAVPWRTIHKRGDGFEENKFVAEFGASGKGPKPIGGGKAYESNKGSGLPLKMVVLLANYFGSDSDTAALMSNFHWQHVQAAQGSSIRLYECLHICAILEGIAKQLLLKKFGWTDKQWRRTKAIDRIKSIIVSYSLPWENGFDSMCADWKRLRPALAHGEFFGPDGAWDDDLFSLTCHVSGAIMALILMDAGWDEPIDFHTLSQTRHLYY